VPVPPTAIKEICLIHISQAFIDAEKSREFVWIAAEDLLQNRLPAPLFARLLLYGQAFFDAVKNISTCQ
jgi:hypothetical protein